MNAFQIQRLVTIICSNKDGLTVSPEKNEAITSTGSVLAIFIFALSVSATIH
jgi:hypothetical protein